MQDQEQGSGRYLVFLIICAAYFKIFIGRNSIMKFCVHLLDENMQEATAFQDLLFSDTCKSLLHVFFSQRATSKVWATFIVLIQIIHCPDPLLH